MIVGIVLLRLIEALSVYVIIKAIYEAYKTNRSNGIESMHKRSHIVVLTLMVVYNAFDLLSYLYFEEMNKNAADYTISVFNLLGLNIIWLIVIDHFKQERKENIKESSWIDLIKF